MDLAEVGRRLRMLFSPRRFDDAWGWLWLHQALQDLRHGVRLLGRNPGFTTTAVLTLALGIGATTAIWTIVHGVLLRPAPFSDIDRLVILWETDRNSGTTREPVALPDYLDFKSRSRTLDDLQALMAGEVTLASPGGNPQHLPRLSVSAGLLPMLGMQPVIGRTFGEHDAAADRHVLISESLWRSRFNRSPSAIGQGLTLDEGPATVIGVVPDSADFGVLQALSAAAYGRGFADREVTRVQVWSLIDASPERFPRSTHPFLLIGRLASNVAVMQAQDELAVIAASLEKEYPQSNLGRGVHVESLADVVFAPVRSPLYLLLGAVALLLIVACVNVAGLLLARGTARSEEIAVRRALGAGRGRLVRQFIAESLLLTMVAGALGVVFAYAGVRLFVVMAPAIVPRATLVSIDATVLVTTLGVLGIAGMTFGLIPAFQWKWLQTHVDVARDAGQRGAVGSSTSRLRQVLVGAELALAVMLLAGAGLLIRSFQNLQHVDPGFESTGVLKAQFRLPPSRYPGDMARWPDFVEQRTFMERLVARVEALPGVTSAATAGHHPMDRGFTNSFRIVGRESEGPNQPELSVRRVSPGYFRTVGLSLISGRAVEDADGPRAPVVAVLNESAARRFFPGQRPEGERIALFGAQRTIVGVVADERFAGLRGDAPLAVYLPLAQAPYADGVLLVRTSADPLDLAAPVRAAFHELDPELAVFGVEPLTRTVSRTLAEPRLTTMALTLFAVVALLLGAVGVYGMLSFEVARRRRELGVRMALGARTGQIVLLVVTQSLLPTLIGGAIGIAAALAFGRFLASLLFGVSPSDPITLVACAITLVAAALVATLVPAARAARVNPATTLR